MPISNINPVGGGGGGITTQGAVVADQLTKYVNSTGTLVAGSNIYDSNLATQLKVIDIPPPYDDNSLFASNNIANTNQLSVEWEQATNQVVLINHDLGGGGDDANVYINNRSQVDGTDIIFPDPSETSILANTEFVIGTGEKAYLSANGDFDTNFTIGSPTDRILSDTFIKFNWTSATGVRFTHSLMLVRTSEGISGYLQWSKNETIT